MQGNSFMLPAVSICWLVAGAIHPAAGADGNVGRTAEELVDCHITAIGGAEAVRSIDNLVYRRGTYREGDFVGEGDATMSLARPWFKLVGDKTRPRGFMEGYDGSAWEWFEDPGVVLRTVGEASEAIRHYAGVESPLLDYAAKGSTARLTGPLTLGSTEVLALELTRRDGHVELFYFDPESCLLIATSQAAPIHARGPDVTTLTRIEDYRVVAGVLLPFRFVTVDWPSGSPRSAMQWAEVKANVSLPEDWFSPPVVAPSRLGRLTAALHEQRDDAGAVLWTYAEFRLAFPQIDVADAVVFAASQIAKMEHVETALALLEQLLQDYPQDADGHYTYGSVCEQAGRRAQARSAYARAVALTPDHRRATAALARLAD